MWGLARDEFLSIRRDPDIIHFTSKYKPWHYLPEPQYKHLYWEALSRTPWKGVAPLGYTPANVLRKALKMKCLSSRIRLRSARLSHVLSRMVRRPILWSDVGPPPTIPRWREVGAPAFMRGEKRFSAPEVSTLITRLSAGNARLTGLCKSSSGGNNGNRG